MPRHPEIDQKGKAAVVVAVRFASDIIEMLDLLTKNRSKFVREATWEKINKEMESDAD
jgi:hypothetical protein